MAAGEWFRIQSGEDEGRLHLAGWSLDAIKGDGWAPNGLVIDDGWHSFGTCPVCFAMVAADSKPGHPDHTWAHEKWHARTDHPVPDGLLTDEDRRAGYARLTT